MFRILSPLEAWKYIKTLFYRVSASRDHLEDLSIDGKICPLFSVLGCPE
jgi:hypothetical protein